MHESVHSCDTQSASKLHFDYSRTNYGKFSLKYRGYKYGKISQVH